MIGPADLEDMMLDYAAAHPPAAETETPCRLPWQLAIWAWWLNPAVLLAFEAQKVIELRLVRLAWGGREGRDEAVSMVTEKFAAAREATETLMGFGSIDTVVARYREHVADNVRRLRAA
jgi:hypothetical protein